MSNSENEIDQEIEYLQKEIQVVVSEKKKIIKETEILRKRIKLLQNQDKEMKVKCTLQVKKLEERVKKKQYFINQSQNKQQKEVDKKTHPAHKQKELSNDFDKEHISILEEKKNKIKEIILNSLNK